MVPKCHAVPCNVQEDLGSTLLDGYQSGECERRISLLSTHTTYVISVFNCKRAEGLQVRRSAAERTGRAPGLPPALALAKSTSWYIPEDFHRHQPSTPDSQPRTRPGLCLREGGCGKKKQKSLERLGRPESSPGGSRAGTEGSAQRPSSEEATEYRAPSSGRGSRAARPRPAQGRRRPSRRPPTPIKAVSPAAVLTRAAPSPTPPRRAHFLSGQIQSPSLTRKFLVDILDASSTAAHSDVPDRSRGASRRAARAPPDPPSAVGRGGNGVRRRRPPGPRACRRREETTPKTPPLGPRLCPEEASPRS